MIPFNLVFVYHFAIYSIYRIMCRFTILCYEIVDGYNRLQYSVFFENLLSSIGHILNHKNRNIRWKAKQGLRYSLRFTSTSKRDHL